MNRDDSHQHKARKRFGQNFLVDHHVINKIIAAIAPKPEQNIIEIGPGRGAITEPILAKCPSLKVVELDRDLIAVQLHKQRKQKSTKGKRKARRWRQRHS